MYQKYIVSVNIGGKEALFPVAAVSEDAARAQCARYGKIVRVEEITGAHIDEAEVAEALMEYGFPETWVVWMHDVLMEFGIIEKIAEPDGEEGF